MNHGDLDRLKALAAEAKAAKTDAEVAKLLAEEQQMEYLAKARQASDKQGLFFLAVAEVFLNG